MLEPGDINSLLALIQFPKAPNKTPEIKIHPHPKDLLGAGGYLRLLISADSIRSQY
jgi:hypothetical protein